MRTICDGEERDRAIAAALAGGAEVESNAKVWVVKNAGEWSKIYVVEDVNSHVYLESGLLFTPGEEFIEEIERHQTTK